MNKNINDVVQFNENHKWRGSLGIITEKKIINRQPASIYHENLYDDIRYQVAVCIPQEGTAYIYVMESENAIEFIGEAKLIPREENDDNNNL